MIETNVMKQYVDGDSDEVYIFISHAVERGKWCNGILLCLKKKMYNIQCINMLMTKNTRHNSTETSKSRKRSSIKRKRHQDENSTRRKREDSVENHTMNI